MQDHRLLTAILCAACLLGGCHLLPGKPALPQAAADAGSSSAGTHTDAAGTNAAGTGTAHTAATADTAKSPPSAGANVLPAAPTVADGTGHAAVTDAAARPSELPDPTRPNAVQLGNRTWFAWLPKFSRPKFEIPRVHKIVIQQGNVITQAMVDRLKPGMTRAQVEFVMGRPVLDNLFSADRWVYVFDEIKPEQPEHHLAMSLYFDKDALQRMSGDLMPGGGKPGDGADEPVPVPGAFVPRGEREQGGQQRPRQPQRPPRH